MIKSRIGILDKIRPRVTKKGQKVLTVWIQGIDYTCWECRDYTMWMNKQVKVIYKEAPYGDNILYIGEPNKIIPLEVMIK